MTAEGEDLSRIRSISDGIFAFAMTLLVITIVVPSMATLARIAPGESTNSQLTQYLLQDWSVFFAYSLAFYVAARWWSSHHRLFRYVYRYDGTLNALNFALLGLIALTPFDTGLLGAYGFDWVSVVFYAAAQALVGLVFLLMCSYLVGPGRRLLYPDAPLADISQRRRASGLIAAAFAISIPVALVEPVAAYILWTVVVSLATITRRGRTPQPAP